MGKEMTVFDVYQDDAAVVIGRKETSSAPKDVICDPEIWWFIGHNVSSLAIILVVLHTH